MSRHEELLGEIGGGPFLDDPTILKATHDDVLPNELLTGGWEALEWRLVRPAQRATPCDAVVAFEKNLHVNV